VYPAGRPPVDGAVHFTCAELEPATADTPVGAPGAEADGITEFDGADAGLVPLGFVAVTVNVYAVPLFSPLTVAAVVEPLTVAVCPPGLAVTV
jgi:hypothetical protein